MSLTLVVLAAGMGSRYGGLKQMDPMGPSGETVLDYSVYDAVRAGFDRVVFIIRRDFETAFREKVGAQLSGVVAVDYAFQSVDDLPSGWRCPAGREKPWGTAHALWCARERLEGPFAVINADDFYGFPAYGAMAGYLGGLNDASGKTPWEGAMVGYPLSATLSAHGGVSRGICRTDATGSLSKVQEMHGITRVSDGTIEGLSSSEKVVLDSETPVSMNFWGFEAAFLGGLDQELESFLQNHGSELKSEWYIPEWVGSLMGRDLARIQVLETDSQWFGVTYPEDRPAVVQSMRDLVAVGAYPSPLFG